MPNPNNPKKSPQRTQMGVPIPQAPSPGQTTGGGLQMAPPPGTAQINPNIAVPTPPKPAQFQGTQQEWEQSYFQSGGGSGRPHHGPGYSSPNYPQFGNPINQEAYQNWYGTLVSPQMSWDSFQSIARNDQLMSQYGVPTEYGLRHRPDLAPRGPLGEGEFQPGMDPMGFLSSGRLPPEHIAPQMQALAERQAAWRNEGLGQSALEALRMGQSQGIGALQQGAANLQSYRPGGAAAMMSPMYSQMASMYGQQSGAMANTYMNMRQSAPDLMHYWRQQQAGEAARTSRRAGYVQLAGQLGGALIGAAGAYFGGAAGGGGGGGMMSAPSSGGGVGAQSGLQTAQNPMNYAAAGGGTVPASPGGTQMTVGEGGQAEHIVPDSQKQQFAARVQGEPSPQPGGPGGVAPADPAMAVMPPPPGQMGLANSFTMDGMPPPMAMEHVHNMVTDTADMHNFLDGMDWNLKNKVA